MKATEQYFSVVLFIMLYKVVLTFESADETLKCDHVIKSYLAILSYGVATIQMEAVQRLPTYLPTYLHELYLDSNFRVA